MISTYGAKCPRVLSPWVARPDSCATTWLPSNDASITIANTATHGPTIITTRYSLTRRARLRGRSTCQVKFSASSIFWIIEMTVKSRNTKPIVPSSVALHVLDELHDLRGQLEALLAERAQELVQHGLELAVVAEGLQHRERDGHDRHDREQRRVDEAHRAHAEIAAREIAHQRVDVAQRECGPEHGPAAEFLGHVEQQPLDLEMQGGEHGWREFLLGRRKRCTAGARRQGLVDNRGPGLRPEHIRAEMNAPAPRQHLRQPHRLPHGGDDGSAVPARRGLAHRRHLGVHGAPAAGPQGKAAGLGVHQREDRQDRGAASRTWCSASRTCRRTSRPQLCVTASRCTSSTSAAWRRSCARSARSRA